LWRLNANFARSATCEIHPNYEIDGIRIFKYSSAEGERVIADE